MEGYEIRFRKATRGWMCYIIFDMQHPKEARGAGRQNHFGFFGVISAYVSAVRAMHNGDVRPVYEESAG